MTFSSLKQITGLALVGLIGTTIIASCNKEEAEPLSKEEGAEWAETFQEELMTENLSVAQAVDELDTHVNLVEAEDFSTALESMLYTLEIQAERYNVILANALPEIDALLEEHPELSFQSEEGWKDVDNGLIKGLWTDVKGLPFKWVETDEAIYIEADFDRFEKTYESGMTTLLKQKIELNQHRLEKELFNQEEYRVAYETVWELIELMDTYLESGEWDRSFDDQYYFYTTMMYGFGEESMNLPGGSLNEIAVEAMKEVANAHLDHPTAQNMLTVIEAIEKEGTYNDAVLEMTNDLINSQFADYLSMLEEEARQSDLDYEKSLLEEEEAGKEGEIDE